MKALQWRKDSLQQTALKQWTSICENLDPYLAPSTKINSEQTVDLNVKAETTKFINKNIKKTCVTLGEAKLSQMQH